VFWGVALSVNVYGRFDGSKSLQNVLHCLTVEQRGKTDLLLKDAALYPTDEESAAPDVKKSQQWERWYTTCHTNFCIRVKS
jgi:hypothetical protein